MFVYNVRYVFADNRDTFWNANVAAEKNDSQEVLDYLYLKLKKPIIVDSISFLVEVHSLTDKMSDKLLSVYGPQPRPRIPSEKKSEDPKPERIIKRRHRRSSAEVAEEKARKALEKEQKNFKFDNNE